MTNGVNDKDKCPLCKATTRVSAADLRKEKMNFGLLLASTIILFVFAVVSSFLPKIGLSVSVGALGVCLVCGGISYDLFQRSRGRGSECYHCRTEDGKPHLHQKEPVLFGGRWFTTDKPVSDRSEALITGPIVILRPTAWKPDKRKPSLLFQPEGSKWQHCWAQGLYDSSYVFVSDQQGRSIGVQVGELLHQLSAYTDIKDLMNRESAVRATYEDKLEKFWAEHLDLLDAVNKALDIAHKTRHLNPEGATYRIRVLLEEATSIDKVIKGKPPEVALPTGTPA